MIRSKAFIVAVVVLAAVAAGTTASAARTPAQKQKALRTLDGRIASALNSFGFVHFLTPFQISEALAAAARPPQTQKELFVLDGQIASAINAYRVAHGLTALQISEDLNAAARQHSSEMAARGYFDHPSANGTAYWKRIQSYYPSASYEFWTVGENLLYSSPTIGVSVAMKWWIESPEHRRNLLDRNWVELGVSSVHATRAGGVYAGYPVTIVTTDFGARH